MNSQTSIKPAPAAPTGEAARPYALYDVIFLRKEILSPNMARLTFGGPSIPHMTTIAPDQRIKVIFPYTDGRAPALPLDGSWLAALQAMPAEERPPRRTYTIRAIRETELDIDFVLHGEVGVASKWTYHAKPGEKLQIAAPVRAWTGETGGYEWQPPEGVRHVLLLGDETALPAIAGILEELATLEVHPRVDAYVEVPTAEDCLPLPQFPGLNLVWLPRLKGEAYGARMIDAARQAEIPSSANAASVEAVPDIDVDKGIMWERATSSRQDFYAWAAGEVQAIKEIRQILLKDRGVERGLANLMGYWRHGKAME